MSSPKSPCNLIWFRQDLRLADHAALHAAFAAGLPVVALFILDERDPWMPGAASRWWLHYSLESLARDLTKLNVTLLLRRGDAAALLPGIAAELNAQAVFVSRLYEPYAQGRDSDIAARLKQDGRSFESFSGALLFEPGSIMTKKSGGQGGKPFQVYTPFARACLAAGEAIGAPLRAPKAQQPFACRAKAMPLNALLPLPSAPDWAGEMRALWVMGQGIGEKAAHARLADFMAERMPDYAAARDIPAKPGTSHLSAALHWGEISPRQIWHALTQARDKAQGRADQGGEKFLRELLWREFSAHLLAHFPQMPEQPLDARFAHFPWREDAGALRAWQQGRTGFPIIDAAMRELWQTGWMHNRMRMAAASFLIKNLLLPWRAGARWFWDTLVDADLASNSASWQWVAGSGADAAPFFRIFNPILQGQKFDPQGAYVRRYVPELAQLPDKYIHAPWLAPPEALARAGVRLGQDYPLPIVDLKATRARALAAFDGVKSSRG